LTLFQNSSESYGIHRGKPLHTPDAVCETPKNDDFSQKWCGAVRRG
jgi:hypothetical protein